MTEWEFVQPSEVGAKGGEPPIRQLGDVVNGRYWLPDPKTGKPGMRTRVTTFAERLEDTWGLNAWEKRITLYGLTLREDLYVKACGTDPDDTKAMDSIIRDAKEAGGGNIGANIGTGLHGLFNAHDAGLPSRAPARYARKVQLYAEALDRCQLTAIPELAERLVFIPEYNLAGRMDGAVIEAARRDLSIIDYKSQKKWHSWGKVALQLAAYSRASVMWDPELGAYVEMPPMRQDRALVFWAPVRPADDVSSDPDFIEVHEVDIERAWNHAAKLSDAVREWQNEGKRKGALSSLYAPAPSLALAVEAYANRLREASTVDELLMIHVEAENRGVWCDELRQTAELTYENFVRGKGYV